MNDKWVACCIVLLLLGAVTPVVGGVPSATTSDEPGGSASEPDDASPTARRDAVLDWYRDHARDVIPACAAAVAPADPPPVDVGAPDRRWVCDAGDRLLAHWRLVFLPRPVAAYAVAHALVGRQYDPSAPAFWTALDARVPNARSRGDWLRQNGARLRL